MEFHLRLESGSDMFGLIEAGQRLGDGFFEVLQDRFRGELRRYRGAVSEGRLVVFNSCDAFFRTSSVRLRHQDWRLDGPCG
jgi:hypothetical protein